MKASFGFALLWSIICREILFYCYDGPSHFLGLSFGNTQPSAVQNCSNIAYKGIVQYYYAERRGCK